MPTGYTADVADGKVTDFRTFALRCARNFGATIAQRDDPMDEPPKLREESSYAATALQKATARLAALDRMTAQEAEAEAQAEYDAEMRERAKMLARHADVRARYEAMLADVEAWEPPTAEHGPLKSFMIDQLRESIKWDCTVYGDAPVRSRGTAWLASAWAKATKDVAYYTAEVETERRRVAGANGWITALYDSLAAVSA